MSNLLQLVGSARFAIVLVAIACFAAYLPFLNAPAHLDDQFLISWLTHLKGTQATFLNFAGPDKLDYWGPLTHFFFISKAIFIKKSIWLWRLSGLLIHVVTSCIVYLIVRRLPSDRAFLVALATALLFAVYPLHPEAVFWISGKASELSAMFLLSAVFCGLSAYQSKKHRSLWLIGSIFLIVLALLTQVNLPISNQAFNFQKWYQLLRNLFFPINNEIVPKYPREYRFMYFLLAPCLAGTLLALWKNKRFAISALVTFVILLLTCLPYVGFACDTRSLYGSRFLYLASFPACLFLTYLLTSFAHIGKRFKALTTVISAVFILLLCIFFLRMTWQQNSSYRAATNVLKTIQKSVSVVVAKTASPYVFIRDLPTNSSVVPPPLQYSIAALDGPTGLLSAWVVPSERLKRSLHEGNYLSTSLRWDKDFLSLLAFDLTPLTNQITELNGPAIVARMMPGLVFYRTASYDAANELLILESNSTVSGPAVRLAADGLSPIDSDFLYIDARINAPAVTANQEVELYWTTRLYDDYNHEDRRSFTQAQVNDGQFHRYHLPLSNAGYFANGTIAAITLGFPAGSKVWIKSLGVTDGKNLRAQLSIEPSSIKPSFNPYASPYYQYPQIPDLGLAQVEGLDELVLNYSVVNIEGANSALVEISETNKFFKNPNGSALSAACLKTMPLSAKEGQFSLKRSDLPGSGIYSIRLMATGPNAQPVGAFSDVINCLAR